ncbi:hypothetical protein LR48_Vigan583s001400 [Vigna angularis]|uniref:Mitochondrial import inner membrane translocase subunit TIM50 n=1 Tax=Phaseolus angularis TaxID=3914 RepID=A0A0L9TE12_PHAAN|nr:hypothetical protein LR48_Vigan583s001400 [Vigna angularis]
MVSIGSPCNCLKEYTENQYDKYDIEKHCDSNVFGDDAFARLYAFVDADIEALFQLFSRRLYRDSCKWEDGHCLKDLRLLAIDMAKVFIIDNTPRVFRLHVNNGIPIKSWYWDCRDHALRNLLPFLEKLVDVDDVRPIIAARFWKRVKSAPPSAAHIRRKFLLRNSF